MSMLSTIQVILFIILLQGLGGSAKEAFSYTSQKEWGGDCQQNGGQQSPIDITTSLSGSGKDVQPIVFPDEAKNVTISKVAVSTTIEYKFPAGLTVKSIPGLNASSQILQIHLHWGGSEHLVNGVRYAVEAHLVTSYVDHLNQDEIKLAVFGRFFEVGDENEELEKMITAQEESVTNIASFNILNLFSGNKAYVYEGSLTTPPCSEIVHWTVFLEPLTLSRSQLKRLYHANLGIEENEPIVMLENYRKPQDINNRSIDLYDFNSSKSTPSVFWLITAPMFFVFL